VDALTVATVASSRCSCSSAIGVNIFDNQAPKKATTEESATAPATSTEVPVSPTPLCDDAANRRRRR
jgi:hypothetical protein